MTTKEQLREEFAEYLRKHWEERESLHVADWWLSRIKERDEKLVKSIEDMKLIEAAFDGNTLMWKQRINRHLDKVISLLNQDEPTVDFIYNLLQ